MTNIINKLRKIVKRKMLSPEKNKPKHVQLFLMLRCGECKELIIPKNLTEMVGLLKNMEE